MDMENMPLSHANPQEGQRPPWKQLLLCLAIVIVLVFCSILIYIFFPHKTPSEPCVAKFGPLPSKWQMTSPKSPCVNMIADWKLKILQPGVYLIYGQVAPNTTYQERAPFEVRLLRNEDIIQTVRDKSKIQYVGSPCELHAEDTIDLIFNSEQQILKNNTHLTVFLIEKIPFIS